MGRGGDWDENKEAEMDELFSDIVKGVFPRNAPGIDGKPQR